MRQVRGMAHSRQQRDALERLDGRIGNGPEPDARHRPKQASVNISVKIIPYTI